jgi:peroxiredoxin
MLNLQDDNQRQLKMKYKLVIILFFYMLSCKEENKKSNPTPKNEKNDIVVYSTENEYKKITENFISWWTYYTNEIDLSSNFIALDESSNKMSKKEFIIELTKGKYIPIKEISTNEIIYKLNFCNNKDIVNTIKQESKTELTYFMREGEPFPEFNYVSLENNSISSKSLKGSKIIIKTWFINCTACIKEFPELNKLVEHSKNKNYKFISFAFDDAEKLVSFLKTKPLNYNNISVSKDFIEKQLKFNQYPTHIVIDENGKIEKIFNNSSKLISYINN